ncbi:hypothetical protein DL546_003492 [Coniochaeta pulveracea]|uniref:Uncharacterized protein n=1 Tax=Coniochaeta pulveracea TaxID=177199 RepID=A0A420YAV6_9PEZI|nr:hypothetical protein DL546_003492 [Coniochaeta pulveracea]
MASITSTISIPGSLTSVPTSALTSIPTSNPTANPTTNPASTPVSTSISAPTTYVRTKTKGGAIAGAAVGCLVAGLLLGFLVAFFLYRNKKRPRESHSSYSPAPTTELKAVEPRSQPPPARDKEAIELNHFLLDSLPDKEIVAELRALETLIQQHVENNYHLHPVQADPPALTQDLSRLGFGDDGNLASEAIVALAMEPRLTRHLALRHVISKVVFSSIDKPILPAKSSSPRVPSMLPPPVAAFLQAVQREHAPPGRFVDDEAFDSALRRWRVLSAFLLHPHRSQRTALPADEVAMAPQAKLLANTLDTFLIPFVHADHAAGRYQQKSHLEAIILEVAKFGYTLLSQPSEWRFVYTTGSPGRAAVVCPGLVKVSDRDGRRYGEPRQIVAPRDVPL